MSLSGFSRTFDAASCVICGDGFVDGTGDMVTVGAKGRKTLLDFSTLHGDVDLHNHLSGMPPVVNVHINCRKAFVRSDRKFHHVVPGVCRQNSELVEQPKKKLRSMSTAFEWHLNCLFCGKFVSDDEKRHNAMTLQMKDTVERKCAERDDEWARQVLGRVGSCLDFPSCEAVYHGQCQINFYTGRQVPGVGAAGVGRPPDETLRDVFDVVCRRLQKDAREELHSVSEVRDMMSAVAGSEELVYSVPWIKQLLKQKYGDLVFFANMQGKNDVVCFKDMASCIINDKWYADRKSNIADESCRLITTAARLLQEEIRVHQFDLDRYADSSDISSTASGKTWLPKLVRTFVQELFSDEVKQVSLGQSLVQAVRPRAVIAPVLLGLGVEMDLKYRSRWLVDHLYRLGFSVSYDEVRRYRHSAVAANEEGPVLPSFPHCFTQWVADNVDHNVATLDGTGTFHGMGIIAATTPTSRQSAAIVQDHVKRIARSRVSNVIHNRGVPLLTYSAPTLKGLCSVTLKSVNCLLLPLTLPSFVNCNMLWRCGSIGSCSDEMPTNEIGWSGYMQHVCKGEHSLPAHITFLPIIDVNPSDEHCIYSTLRFIEKQAMKLSIVNPCVTFDAPLWLKAQEILHASGLGATVVCRLGGFHTMMSFLGSVGTLMAGSGLQEAMEVCYGPNAVLHMLSGKAVARAVRGHFMVDDVLGRLLLGIAQTQGVLSDTQLSILRNMFDESLSTGTLPTFEDDDFKSLVLLLSGLCNELMKGSRTCKLWLQYMEYVYVLKLFIIAERTGNWLLHLHAVKCMLNVFAATGHNMYTKCVRLYLQLMSELHSTHPWLYVQFVENGFHAIRRSDRFWAGLWSDLVIEQTLMKTVKSRGGLTHGSGLNESVRLVWTESLSHCAGIHEAMSLLVRSEMKEEHHKDLGKCRRARDRKDVARLSAWFVDRNPFSTQSKGLRCLSTGKTATDGDGINCDMVEAVGEQIQMSLDKTPFRDVKLKKKEQVKTLERLRKGVICDNKVLFLHSTHLFNRLIVLVERTTDMTTYFAYELTPQPASLFKDSCMRKPDKAALGRYLCNEAIVTGYECHPQHVLDGGCLLHKVKWPKVGTYGDVVNMYVSYVKFNFGADAVIVFDGYDSSTKDHEHVRRTGKAGKVAADVNVAVNMSVHASQEEFLANVSNKCQFITLLSSCLQEKGFRTCQARDDADTMIVKVALQLAEINRATTVVAADTDVLVLLVSHLKENMGAMYMLMQPTTGKYKGEKIVDIRKVRANVGFQAVQHLLVLHAIAGCDTTSALFGNGKVSVLKKLLACNDSSADLQVMGDVCAVQEEVGRAGRRLLAVVYGGNVTDSLNCLRYTAYMKMCASSRGRPMPERLPPTENAAYFHSLRVHLQVIQWSKLSTDVPDPTYWGWRVTEYGYEPIAMEQEPAPGELLKVIRCSCKLESRNQCGGNACTCRRNGLRCMTACGKCHGTECLNTQAVVDDELCEDVDGDDTEDEYESDECNIFVDSSDLVNEDDVDWWYEETVV